MARISVYLPDEVAADARAAGLNISKLTRVAVQRELTRSDGWLWLRRIAWERTDLVFHDAIVEAVDRA
jgi:post-segregation antitoxin (ccd killing protein)